MHSFPSKKMVHALRINFFKKNLDHLPLSQLIVENYWFAHVKFCKQNFIKMSIQIDRIVVGKVKGE